MSKMSLRGAANVVVDFFKQRFTDDEKVVGPTMSASPKIMDVFEHFKMMEASLENIVCSLFRK
jgi:hypothetical protein